MAAEDTLDAKKDRRKGNAEIRLCCKKPSLLRHNGLVLIPGFQSMLGGNMAWRRGALGSSQPTSISGHQYIEPSCARRKRWMIRVCVCCDWSGSRVGYIEVPAGSGRMPACLGGGNRGPGTTLCRLKRTDSARTSRKNTEVVPQVELSVNSMRCSRCVCSGELVQDKLDSFATWRSLILGRCL